MATILTSCDHTRLFTSTITLATLQHIILILLMCDGGIYHVYFKELLTSL